ncbi:MAG TPA: hypothetical protein VMU84_17990 [Thermoanaerobaculia bacterium]|nr:hypothetical protein [Thermoanaerobaculia bacterium]
MIDPEHAHAQQLASDAQAASIAGNVEQALQLYAAAAEAESRALDRVPAEKIRTLGIIGVSVAALYTKAGKVEQAEAVCRDLLVNRELFPEARTALLDLLESLPQGRVLPWRKISEAEPEDAQREAIYRTVESFGRMHTLVTIFDGDPQKWIDFIERFGTDYERHDDLPFLQELRERFASDPTLLDDIQRVVNEVSEWRRRLPVNSEATVSDQRRQTR